MNKRGGIGGVIVFLLLLLILLVIVKLPNNFNDKKDCFEDIAEDFCDDKKMDVGNVNPIYFTCVEEERQITGHKYKFTKEEIKECLDK